MVKLGLLLMVGACECPQDGHLDARHSICTRLLQLGLQFVQWVDNSAL